MKRNIILTTSIALASLFLAGCAGAQTTNPISPIPISGGSGTTNPITPIDVPGGNPTTDPITPISVSNAPSGWNYDYSWDGMMQVVNSKLSTNGDGSGVTNILWQNIVGVPDSGISRSSGMGTNLTVYSTNTVVGQNIVNGTNTVNGLGIVNGDEHISGLAVVGGGVLLQDKRGTMNTVTMFLSNNVVQFHPNLAPWGGFEFGDAWGGHPPMNGNGINLTNLQYTNIVGAPAVVPGADFQPNDFGSVLWSYDPLLATTHISIPAGTSAFVKLKVPNAFCITNMALNVLSGVTASGGIHLYVYQDGKMLQYGGNNSPNLSGIVTFSNFGNPVVHAGYVNIYALAMSPSAPVLAAASPMVSADLAGLLMEDATSPVQWRAGTYNSNFGVAGYAENPSGVADPSTNSFWVMLQGYQTNNFTSQIMAGSLMLTPMNENFTDTNEPVLQTQ